MAQQLTTRDKIGQIVTTVRSEEFAGKLRPLLGQAVPIEKFQQVVALAVQTNPDLATKADKSSLLLACLQAAKSKLVPDGKQGALVMYGTAVQWQVMIGGLRIMLARHGFDLRTEIVYENDEFDYALGDDPHITHKPPKFGTPRGKMIGVYAIARGPDGKRYRRVMDKAAVDFVKSKAKTGAVWNTWYDPMAEKTVGRALVKQLPIYEEDEELREAINNDDQHFDLDKKPAASDTARAVQAAAAGQPAPQSEDVIEGDFSHVDTSSQQQGRDPDDFDPLD